MSKKLTTSEQRKFYRKYHIKGCGNLNSVKLNVVSIHVSNTKEHEIEGKCEICWELASQGIPYITEAARSPREGEAEMFSLKKEKVVDIVSFPKKGGSDEYEVVHKHETDEQIKFYRRHGTIVFIPGDKITCEVCKLDYPKRNKKGICKNCEVQNGRNEKLCEN